MKYKFILFSPWLLKSPVTYPHHSSQLSPKALAFLAASATVRSAWGPLGKEKKALGFRV